jgi:hypothetical protein
MLAVASKCFCILYEADHAFILQTVAKGQSASLKFGKKICPVIVYADKGLTELVRKRHMNVDMQGIGKLRFSNDGRERLQILLEVKHNRCRYAWKSYS